jgi:hypothetical protein
MSYAQSGPDRTLIDVRAPHSNQVIAEVVGPSSNVLSGRMQRKIRAKLPLQSLHNLSCSCPDSHFSGLGFLVSSSVGRGVELREKGDQWRDELRKRITY